MTEQEQMNNKRKGSAMITPRNKIKVILLACLGLGLHANAATYTSNNSGDWATGIWTTPGNPDVGGFGTTGGNQMTGTDSVIINGHDVTAVETTYGSGNDRFNVSNGNSVTINGGGSLTLAGGGSYLFGYHDGVPGAGGTVNINSGLLTSQGNNLFGLGTSSLTMTVGDGTGGAGDAILDIGNNLLQGLGAMTLTVNGDGRIDGGGPRVGRGASATVVMNGDSLWNTPTRNDVNLVGWDSGTTSTMTMNDNASYINNSRDGFRLGNNNGTTGILTMNGSSSFTMTQIQGGSDRAFSVGWQGAGILNLNDNATIDTGAHQIFVARDANSTGTVNQTGGTLNTIILGMARVSSASGTYLLSGGTINASDRFDIGHDGNGILTQTGGIANTPFVRFGGGAGTASGTYQLEGGTLQTDSILNNSGAGAFDWGAGTLTHYTPSGATGGTDYTALAFTGTAGPSTGPSVQVGRELSINTGTITTGDADAGGGVGSLDLRNIYIDNGTRFNNLRVTGTLDLSNGLNLSAIGSPYLLRPQGLGYIDQGALPLLAADTIIGFGADFDDAEALINFTQPSDDGRGFSHFAGTFTGASSLDENTWFLSFLDNEDAATWGLGTGTVDLIVFNYKLQGSVPEPQSLGMLILGGLFLNTIRRNKKK